MDRTELLEQVALIITEIDLPHPVRAGIDGIDGAGKTTIADELVAPIERHGRSVIRASVDLDIIRFVSGEGGACGCFVAKQETAAIDGRVKPFVRIERN